MELGCYKMLLYSYLSYLLRVKPQKVPVDLGKQLKSACTICSAGNSNSLTNRKGVNLGFLSSQ